MYFIHWVINDEHVDFGALLSTCSYDDAGHTTSSHTPATPTSSLATWMEAWNIYAMVMLREYPAKAIELLAYQSIICSASKSMPLHAWLEYDRKFRALAAANPTLQWDQQFSNYWLEAITARPLNPGRWPCPYCKSTAHYPENCPKFPFQDSRKPSEQSSHRANDALICGDFNRSNCTRQTHKYQHIYISSKGKYPVFSCLERKLKWGPWSSHQTITLSRVWYTKWSLSIECDILNDHSQLSVTWADKALLLHLHLIKQYGSAVK